MNSIAPLGFCERRHYNGARFQSLHSENGTRRLRTLPTTPQPGADDLDQEQFDRLLQWLNTDRAKAADQYEWIRKRLIKIFVSRGSNRPEELADSTINRVARKLEEIKDTYVGDPAHYFSSVAGYIFRESLRSDKAPVVMPPPVSPSTEDEERDYICLERCLDRLPKGDRELAIAYYQQEKQAKIDIRKRLAEQMGLAMNALRIRACRIRSHLLTCVELCRSENA